MSSTITYKNNQISSFETGTKTLKTSGKYMEDDITINVNDANLIPSNIKHDTNIFGVTGTFKTRIEYITMTTSERNTSITFTGLKAKPIAFFYDTMGDITMNRSYRNLTSVSYDGTTVRACTYYMAGGNTGYGRYFTTCHYIYSNGSLTITSAGTGTSGYFYNGQHILIYVYEE